MTVRPHIGFAHSLWEEILEPTDAVIDATCGNGRDTLFLAQKIPLGSLLAIDIQEKAIETTKELTRSLPYVQVVQTSHESFPWEKPTKLIVYNLGYLPGGNKQITTQIASTLRSLEAAKKIISPGGVISITCYPGHPEGAIETSELIPWAFALHPRDWRVYHFVWGDRPEAPSLLILQRN